ncbi:MAG: histidine kinase [Gammaproteobacteria bacterium]
MNPSKPAALCLVLVAAVSATACTLLLLPMPGHAHAAIVLMASLTVLALLGLRHLLRRPSPPASPAQARDARLHYHHFANTLHEGVWMVDAAGATVLANARLCQMFACDMATLQGAPLQRFLGDNPPARLTALLDLDGVSASRSHDLTFRRADGTLGWAIISSRAAPDHVGAPGCLLLLTDISQRKATELELAAVKQSLELRIRTRTAELRRANEQLRVQVCERAAAEQELASSYAQLRRLTAHLETAKEEERKRIALGIHDELGQNLLALKLDAQLLQARCADPALQLHVHQALATIDASIHSVRAIINELHPSTLELGLGAATEWLVGQFRTRSKIACRLSVHGDDHDVADEQRAAVIFRILRESLDQIIGHARASHVDVVLDIDTHQVAVTISEDGGGLPALHNGIRERVNVFGGTLDMRGSPGGGTRLRFCIPLASRADLDQMPA